MDKSHYIAALQRLAVFSKLNTDQLTVLLDYAQVNVLSKGAVLVTEDMVGDRSYFVCEGSVERTFHDSDRGAGYDHFGAGVLVGEMAMLTEHIYSATVTALSEVKVLTFKRDDIYQLFCDHEDIGDIFLDTIRSRLELLAQLNQKDLVEHGSQTLDGFLPAEDSTPYMN